MNKIEVLCYNFFTADKWVDEIRLDQTGNVQTLTQMDGLKITRNRGPMRGQSHRVIGGLTTDRAIASTHVPSWPLHRPTDRRIGLSVAVEVPSFDAREVLRPRLLR